MHSQSGLYMSSELVIYCDGASRGNPGPAALGAAIFDGEANPVAELSEALGMKTNNEAEYLSLVRALEWASEHKSGTSLTVRMDSELVVKQIRGQYRVKNERLKALHQRARELLREFPEWSIEHVRREKNKEADALANRALDKS